MYKHVIMLMTASSNNNMIVLYVKIYMVYFYEHWQRKLCVATIDKPIVCKYLRVFLDVFNYIIIIYLITNNWSYLLTVLEFIYPCATVNTSIIGSNDSIDIEYLSEQSLVTLNSNQYHITSIFFFLFFIYI